MTEAQKAVNKVIDKYYHSLRYANVPNIPLTDDVIFIDPVRSKEVKGAPDVRELLYDAALSMGERKMEEVERFIKDQSACVVFVLHYKEQKTIICDYFVFEGENIKRIQPVLDPRVFI